MNKSSKAQAKMADEIKLKLLRQPLYGRSIEYADNRISLYSAQKGMCAVTGEKFSTTDQIHCNHKLPRFVKYATEKEREQYEKEIISVKYIFEHEKTLRHSPKGIFYFGIFVLKIIFVKNYVTNQSEFPFDISLFLNF